MIICGSPNLEGLVKIKSWDTEGLITGSMKREIRSGDLQIRMRSGLRLITAGFNRYTVVRRDNLNLKLIMWINGTSLILIKNDIII